jgi:tetratricopeptide (TPR) repeat protein
MPKIIKKRPAKKKPVQEPEVKTAALGALDLMKQKRRQAIMIVSVVVVVALALMVFKIYTSSQNQKTHDLEMEANTYYYGEAPYTALPPAERWKKALDLYKKSIDIKATPTALFYLGNCYYNLSDYENAIKQYTSFTEKFSGNYGILPLVYQKLADAYFKTGKNDKALETLSDLARVKNGIFRDTALHMEANYYERVGDTAKAQERYKSLASEFPASPWAPEATAKVAQSEKKEGAGTATGQTPPRPAEAPKK